MSRTNYSSLSHTRGVNDDEDDIIDTNQDIKLANLPPRSEASRSPSISLQRFPQLPVHKSSSPQSTNWTVESKVDEPHTIINDVARSGLQLEFSSTKQFWRLFGWGAARFLVTFTLASLLFVTIYEFSRKKVISDEKKRWFNAFATGFSLALGLSIASGFKAMAINLRWWLLSRQQRSLQDVDKILRAENLTAIAKLMTSSIRQNIKRSPLKWNWKLIFGCAFWLLLNLTAQLAVALIGLTYSPDTGVLVALLVPGSVLYPNMTEIHPEAFSSNTDDYLNAQQYTANNLGIMAIGFDWGSSSNIPPLGALWATQGHTYYQADDLMSWEFVFVDSPPTGILDAATIYTNRTINSTFSCQSWVVVSGGNGTSRNLIISKNANGGTFNITVPTTGGIEQTTFFTNGSTCGDGCTIISAFEASNTQPWYYECNITVGHVLNASNPAQEVGIRLREMASSAIALQGYGLTALSNGAQSQVYPSQSIYGEPQSGSPVGIGSLMSRFAIGVVAAAAIYPNQTIIQKGLQPQLGNQLNVSHWGYLTLILCLLVLVQGLGFVMTAFMSNRVVIKDESAYATARLLRPIMERLGDSGNAAEGDEICEALGDGPDTKLIYTVVKDENDDGLFHVELGPYKRVRAFPEGRYD